MMIQEGVIAKEGIGFFSFVHEGGRFYVNKEDIEKIMANKKGLEWELALDGFIDPSYGSSILVINNFQKINDSLSRITGTIVYNHEPRKFSGELKPADPLYKKQWECHFEFTEPAAQ